MEEEKKNYTLDEIIEESFDFSDVSNEEKKKMIGETSGMIMEMALLKSFEKSSEETQAKFNDFIASEPNEEQMSEFVAEHFPNFGDVVIAEIQEFQKQPIE